MKEMQQSKSRDVVFHDLRILTDGGGEPLEHSSIRITGERITDIGPSAELKSKHQGAQALYSKWDDFVSGLL